MRSLYLSNQVEALDRMATEPSCETVCGDGGCQCLTRDDEPIHKVDHLMMMNEHDEAINCVCSSYSAEWLPVSLRAWTPLRLVYNVAQYAWNRKGFVFTASYEFNADGMCGQKTFTTHSGELSSGRRAKEVNATATVTAANQQQHWFNAYHYQQCTWILDSNVERQLTIEMDSDQSRSCQAWNITIHEFNALDDEHMHVGEQLHVFCARDRHKVFTMPWTSSTVVVR